MGWSNAQAENITTLLYHNNIILPTVDGQLYWDLGDSTIDITKYESIYFKVSAIPSSNAVSPTDTFIMGVSMLSDNVAPTEYWNALTVEQCEVPITYLGSETGGSYGMINAQAVGSSIWPRLTMNPVSVTYNTQFTIDITGSTRSIANQKIFVLNTSMITAMESFTLNSDSLAYGLTLTVPALSNILALLPYINTRFDMSWIAETTTTPVNGTDIYIASASPNNQVVGVYEDKSYSGAGNTIKYWQLNSMGAKVPKLWLNNHDSFDKNYNLFFSWQR